MALALLLHLLQIKVAATVFLFNFPALFPSLHSQRDSLSKHFQVAVRLQKQKHPRHHRFSRVECASMRSGVVATRKTTQSQCMALKQLKEQWQQWQPLGCKVQILPRQQNAISGGTPKREADVAACRRDYNRVLKTFYDPFPLFTSSYAS